MLLKITSFCVFGVVQCNVFARFDVQKTLFSTYCTLLLILYALPFWNVLSCTKLIVLRSEVCSDWPAIQCIVIGRIPHACDRNVMPLTMLWCRVLARRLKNNTTNKTIQLLNSVRTWLYIIMTHTENIFCKSQIQALCAPAEFLLASNGKNVVLRPNKILLKAHFLRYQPKIW